MPDIPGPPAGLNGRGQRLWSALHEMKEFGPAEEVLVEEICRIADRLEKLDEVLRGDTDTWVRLVHDLRTEDYEIKVDGALTESRQQQNVLKQLIVALRLPDSASGKQPQHRGARGAYQKSKPGTVSVLDRMRERKGS